MRPRPPPPHHGPFYRPLPRRRSVGVIRQIATAFAPGGLTSSDRRVTYAEPARLGKVAAPAMFVVGDMDRMCPPAGAVRAGAHAWARARARACARVRARAQHWLRIPAARAWRGACVACVWLAAGVSAPAALFTPPPRSPPHS